MKRLLVVALCGAGIGLAWLDFRSYTRGQSRALERIERHELDRRHPELRTEVRRRYDPVDAEVRVALALLNGELDRGWIAALPPERARLEVERGTERLDEALAIAGAAWQRRPASWQAAMVLGGATYLRRYRERDAGLMAELGGWQHPLEAAHHLAPAEPGPVRFLAAAYLGNWASLSPERRRATIELLARAFEDRTTFRLLARDWLRVAPSHRRALSIVPPQPWAWEALQDLFAAAKDWELYVEAREHWYETLRVDLDRSLREVRLQVAGGENLLARRRLLALLPQIPRNLGFAPQFAHLVELLPAGPASDRSAEIFAGWLEWTFDVCLLSECPFGPAISSRLARLAGDPPPHQRALAFLVAGDLPRAELLERRFAYPAEEGWAAYYLLMAEHLARSGKPEAAQASLDRLPASWHRRPRFWTAVRELAVGRGDEDRARTAEAALARLGRSSWTTSDWIAGDGVSHLDLWPSTRSTGLALEIVDAGRGGSVAEVFWDGNLLGVRRAARSPEILRFDLPVSTGLHRLSIRFLVGGSARPAAVELL